MKTLNIVRSAPDDLEKKFIETFSESEGDKVITLYEGDVPGVGFKDFAMQARNAEMIKECDRYLVF